MVDFELNFRTTPLRFTVLMLAVIALFFVTTAASCPEKPETVQKYEALDKAADLRLAILRGAADYYSMGIIDEATKLKIIEVDKYVQAAGKSATAALKEVVMLEQLRKLDPTQVTPEQYAAAVQKYQDARTNLRNQWRGLIALVDPYLMKWIQEASIQ
ncbi:MAG: hypothetical protein ACWGQW_02905 [bacterium]